MSPNNSSVVIALPKGRISEDLTPMLSAVGVSIEPDFFLPDSRKLKFMTNYPEISVVKVRSSDVPTFVNFGAADVGVAGLDIIYENNYDNIYNMFDLNIGKCKMVIAGKQSKFGSNDFDIQNIDSLRIATKYPNITKKYFSNLDIQAEMVKLNGAIEVAPDLGLSDYIVDLVQTGSTLRENHLAELHKILDISSHLIVNKQSLNTKNAQIVDIINNFRRITR